MLKTNTITQKFMKLGCDNAPGQESSQVATSLPLKGEKLSGTPVDFSHGDVDAFEPLPGAFEAFSEGFRTGGSQAYTEYKGKYTIRQDVAQKLSQFTGDAIDPDKNIILTPGTQGALFLAMGSLITSGDKVAIVEPDYFANRKLVEFFDGEIVPIQMDYYASDQRAGLNLNQLENAFKNGVKLFLFSNPNNPTGVIYSYEEIVQIAFLAKKYNATLLVDELYSRQVFDHHPYTHLCAQQEIPDNLITIIGPSKTESLSGFRLGAAFGSVAIITRMEKLQAIVSLSTAGYCQSVYKVWFNEPDGFMAKRIADHQAIRDAIIDKLKDVDGVRFRTTEAGSYLFVELPKMDVDIVTFSKIVRQLADVTITPGTEFGPTFTHAFRINFSQNHQAAVDAIERVLKIMERYRL